MVIATTMCKLLLALMTGFYLYKKGIFTKETNRALSSMIAKITNPALMIYSLSTLKGDSTDAVIRLLLGGCVVYVLYVLIGWLFTRIFHIKKGLRGVYMSMILFANWGFMGFPVVQSLFGTSAIFYISIFNMPFNFLAYSLGLWLMGKDAEITGSGETFKFDLKNLFSAGTISAVLVLVLFLANISLPDAVYECSEFIGNVTMPLAMIIIGASMAGSSFAEVKSEKGIVPLTIVRLVFLPAFVWCFMHLVTTDKTLINICTVGAGMPVGALTSMLSAQWPEQNKCTSINVAVTTVASMVTVPILALIIGA